MSIRLAPGTGEISARLWFGKSGNDEGYLAFGMIAEERRLSQRVLLCFGVAEHPSTTNSLSHTAIYIPCEFYYLLFWLACL